MTHSQENFILIYITHADMAAAKKVAEALLRDRLIACVNYFPIENSYWWKGEIEHGTEIVSLVKTRSDNWDRVRAAVEAMHPYETPCIMKMEVEANAAYAQWIHDETK